MSSTRLDTALSGVVAVLVTPYRDRTAAVDADRLAALARSLDGSGVHALTALGNTAEVHQLDEDERRTVLRAVAAGRSRSALVAGLAGPLSECLRTAEFAAELGYDAVMPHEPADPFGDGPGLTAFFHAVAETSALPVVPYLRSPRLAGSALDDLTAHPLVIGAKWARPDTPPAAPPGFRWVNGLAESATPRFAGLGITGFTSGLANARPDLALAVHTALEADDLATLRRILALIGPAETLRAQLHARHNVAVIKELLHLAGVDVGSVRPPHAPLDETLRAHLQHLTSTWPADHRTTSGIAR